MIPIQSPGTFAEPWLPPITIGLPLSVRSQEQDRTDQLRLAIIPKIPLALLFSSKLVQLLLQESVGLLAVVLQKDKHQ